MEIFVVVQFGKHLRSGLLSATFECHSTESKIFLCNIGM